MQALSGLLETPGPSNVVPFWVFMVFWVKVSGLKPKREVHGKVQVPNILCFGFLG